MVGKEIKAYLEEHGIMQTWLAKKIGMPASILSSRLSGKSSLAADELYAIANALNVPIETFRPEKLKGGTH